MPFIDELEPGDLWVHFAKPGLESETFLGWARENGVFHEGLHLETPSPEDLVRLVDDVTVSDANRAHIEAFTRSFGTRRLLLITFPFGRATQKVEQRATLVTHTIVQNERMWISNSKNRNGVIYQPVEVPWVRELLSAPPPSTSEAKSAFERLLDEDLLDDSSDQPAFATSEEL